MNTSNRNQVVAPRLAYVDGLRGLAVLAVLLFHAWIFSDDWRGMGQDLWWNPIANGHTGVHLFLVLSGFCVCWPYVNGKGMDFMEFAVRRGLRLLPPYFVALLLMSGLAVLFSMLGWLWPEWPGADPAAVVKTFAVHVFLAHNLLPNHMLAIAGPFWSLALEAQLYLTVPLLLVVWRRWGVMSVALTAFAVTVAFRWIAYVALGGAAEIEPHKYAYTVMHSLPARWWEFALGMIAACLIARGKPWMSAGKALCLGFVFLLSGAWWINKIGQFHPLSDPMIGGGFFFLLLAASNQGNEAKNWWTEALSWKPLVAFGEISFSIYLVHQPFLRLIDSWLQTSSQSSRNTFAIALVTSVPAAIVIGMVFYRYVEAPSVRWAQGWRAKRSRIETVPQALVPAVAPAQNG